MPFTASAQAQAAVLKSWAFTENRTARVQANRDAFEANFEKKVDPDGKLPPLERAQRAALLCQSYFKDLTAKSISARRAKAAERTAATEAMRAAREKAIQTM